MHLPRHHVGFMKIPDPTMPPITIMVASNTPSCRADLGFFQGCRLAYADSPSFPHRQIRIASLRPASCYTGIRIMPDFCTCGAQLPPDSLFCHKCGKPQRDVIEPEPETGERAEFVLSPTPRTAAAPQPPADQLP